MSSDSIEREMWMPTHDAMRRWQSWVGESNTHRRPDADETSIAERVWTTGDVKRVLEEMNVNMDAVTRSAMAEVLAPWPPDVTSRRCGARVACSTSSGHSWSAQSLFGSAW
jgi:hypothetical protein